MDNQTIQPIQTAERIYNEFRDLILSDLTTEELIKKCSQHAAYIVYDSSPTTFDWEECKNDQGKDVLKMVNFKSMERFWFDVREKLTHEL
jgi:hypothetical protein